MKLKKKYVGMLTALIISGFSSSVLAADMNVELRHWKADLDSSARVTDNGIGSTVDFNKDLGINDKSFNEIRLSWGKVRLAYTNFDYTGFNTLSRDIDFNGDHYSANEDVTSKLDIKYYRLGLMRPLINSTVKVDWMIDIKGFSFDTAIESELDSGSKKFSGALPTLGVAASSQITNNLSAYGEISGLPFGKYGHILDAEAGVKYSVINNLSVAAGYRVFDLKAKDDEDFAQIKLTGPYFKASYFF